MEISTIESRPPAAVLVALDRRGASAGAGAWRLPWECASSSPAAPVRVGVVDSSPELAERLAQALAGEPALRVTGVTTTVEAALQLARSGVDLLLVDCRLPESGGPRLARALRRELPSVAVVGLSSRLDRPSRAALIAEGALGAVDRMMAPEDLAMVVREAFAGSSLLRLAHA